MLEFLLIVFIILLFIFPVLALAVLLRLLTTAVLYRKLYLFGHQLTEGKNILVPNGITQCGNFITSIVMAILSSGVVFNFFFLLGTTLMSDTSTAAPAAIF